MKTEDMSFESLGKISKMLDKRRRKLVKNWDQDDWEDGRKKTDLENWVHTVGEEYTNFLHELIASCRSEGIVAEFSFEHVRGLSRRNGVWVKFKLSAYYHPIEFLFRETALYPLWVSTQTYRISPIKIDLFKKMIWEYILEGIK